MKCHDTRRITPSKCSFCGGHDVCIDTELACLVCCQCGIQGPIGFEHTYRTLSCVDTNLPYEYQPKVYLLRLLDQLQGFRVPRVAKNVLLH